MANAAPFFKIISIPCSLIKQISLKLLIQLITKRLNFKGKFYKF